nr:MAG TPA: hypothetical protein [Bacteriophage sp.]DAV59039.1 MAG TPA: hypothetical protein [Bacteriophage sp.]
MTKFRECSNIVTAKKPQRTFLNLGFPLNPKFII